MNKNKKRGREGARIYSPLQPFSLSHSRTRSLPSLFLTLSGLLFCTPEEERGPSPRRFMEIRLYTPFHTSTPQPKPFSCNQRAVSRRCPGIYLVVIPVHPLENGKTPHLRETTYIVCLYGISLLVQPLEQFQSPVLGREVRYPSLARNTALEDIFQEFRGPGDIFPLYRMGHPLLVKFLAREREHGITRRGEIPSHASDNFLRQVLHGYGGYIRKRTYSKDPFPISGQK